MRPAAAILAALALLPPPSLAGESQVTGIVAHVRDGDTIEVGPVAVRLQGLHAPELDEALGPEARAAMVGLVEGKAVACDLTGERNRDRVIGVCYRDGEDVAALLVALGLARDCPRFSGGRYKALEREPGASLPLPAYCVP
jgi:micrococcal nuclease